MLSTKTGGIKSAAYHRAGKRSRRHAGEEIIQTGGAVEESSEKNTCEAGTHEHRGKHQNAGQFWQRLAAEKLGSGHEKSPSQDRKMVNPK